jgi:dTDP-4-amino-4,6-dideoxygalactose transaminase
LINDVSLAHRAEIIREKGTNRSEFFRGQVDKYTWCDVGSSYLPGELIAAFLWAQMEAADEITHRRLAVWNAYHQAFASLEHENLLRRPIVPKNCTHNAHMYYMLLPDLATRSAFIGYMRKKEIASVFHYVPLHSSLAGKCFGRAHGELTITVDLANRLVRLPLWVGLDEKIEVVIAEVFSGLGCHLS